MGGISGFRICDGLRRGVLSVLLPGLLMILALPMAPAGAASRYNDWELWASSANAILPAKPSYGGAFRVNIAGGAALVPDYMGSDDLSVRAIPLLDVNYRGTLFLSTQQGVGWNMWRKRTLRAGPRLTFDFGRKATDSPSLSGLPDVESGVEAGLFFEKFAGSWRFKGDIRKEIGGGHGGLLINGEAAWGQRWSAKTSLIMGMRTTYMDDTYAESYFTVSAANARVGRPAFAATGGFRDVSPYVQLIYDFTQSFYLATELRATTFLGQAADSPITETDNSFTGTAMIGFRF